MHGGSGGLEPFQNLFVCSAYLCVRFAVLGAEDDADGLRRVVSFDLRIEVGPQSGTDFRIIMSVPNMIDQTRVDKPQK